jgi:predicted metal-dependent TIM-barrel fold hydrolase
MSNPDLSNSHAEARALLDGLQFLDPHVHMTSRTADDYQRMAEAGIIAIIEPSFWLGQPRTNAGSYQDYLSSLVGWEPFRASQFGIKHYCTIGLNSKEANNEALAEAVMELLPLYAIKDGVVAIGEIGFDDGTALEEKYFRAQLELAKSIKMPVQVHTPHRNKKQGTIRSMEICLEHGLDPEWVVIDHNNEETVKSVLDAGFWAAFTIYPNTKMGNERMVAVAQQYGSHHIIVDSSADWGLSDPLAVPKTALLMLQSGISRQDVQKMTYYNALEVFGKSGNISEADLQSQTLIDQRKLYNDNSVLRGQVPFVDDVVIR